MTKQLNTDQLDRLAEIKVEIKRTKAKPQTKSAIGLNADI